MICPDCGREMVMLGDGKMYCTHCDIRDLCTYDYRYAYEEEADEE